MPCCQFTDRLRDADGILVPCGAATKPRSHYCVVHHGQMYRRHRPGDGSGPFVLDWQQRLEQVRAPWLKK